MKKKLQVYKLGGGCKKEIKGRSKTILVDDMNLYA
jgi:hypothetical protein